jgi:hypothetical protein
VTPEQYYSAIKKLGLRPSNVPTVFIDSEGMTWNVPSPEGRTPEQVAEILAKIKERLGITQRD